MKHNNMKENENRWNDYPVIGDTNELNFIVEAEGHIKAALTTSKTHL